MNLIQRHRRAVSTKSQIISKPNCQGVNSPKKRTNEFVFLPWNVIYIIGMLLNKVLRY
jgi:hypothetical protein